MTRADVRPLPLLITDAAMAVCPLAQARIITPIVLHARSAGQLEVGHTQMEWTRRISSKQAGLPRRALLVRLFEAMRG